MRKKNTFIGLLLLLMLTFPVLYKSVHAIACHSNTEDYHRHVATVADEKENCPVCDFEYAKFSGDFVSTNWLPLIAFVKTQPRLIADQIFPSFDKLNHKLRAPPAN